MKLAARASQLSLLLVVLLLATVSQAQDSPQDFVNAHNAARGQVGVGPIAWDATLASFAQRYISGLAGDCRMVHSGGPYGENLAWSSGDMAGTGAVSMWVDEKAFYDYSSNTCQPGKVCGHYTQVVWSDSLRLGCAKVRCNTGGTLISCNYDPPGNFIGRKPY